MKNKKTLNLSRVRLLSMNRGEAIIYQQINKHVIELAGSDRVGEYFFSVSLWASPVAQSINLRKKINLEQYFTNSDLSLVFTVLSSFSVVTKLMLCDLE